MKVCLVNPTKTIQKLINDLSRNLKLESIPAENENAVELIREKKPHCVILNWNDPGAEKICSSVRNQKNKNGYTHIIAISTREEVDNMQSALNSGADDFILIPFTDDILKLKLNIAAKNIKLHQDLVNVKKKLLKSTREDAVTSTLNRRSLLDEIIKEMGRASRKNETTAAIMVNIQNLKEIELNRGNHVTDKFLAEFSRRLNKCIRPYDLIGRYDLEKFLIYLPNTGTEGSRIVADRIMEKLSKEKFTTTEKDINPCVSIGISELDPDDINIGKTKDHHDEAMNDLILESFIRRSEFAAEKACSDGEHNIQIYTF